jgi:hypothetical protein
MDDLEMSLYYIAHDIALQNGRWTDGSWRGAMGYDAVGRLHLARIGMVRVGSALGQDSGVNPEGLKGIHFAR